jgi:hypothetical protein
MTYQYFDNNCVISTGDSVYLNTISTGNIQINYTLFNINSDQPSMSNGMIHFLRKSTVMILELSPSSVMRQEQLW